MNIIKKIGTGAIRKISGIRFQTFWNMVYNISLVGMNLGGGGYFENSGEKYVMKYIRDHVIKSNYPVLFDVGANIGGYTNELLKYIKTGEIHCFEPSLNTYQTLCKNVKASNVVFNNIGMSSDCSKSTLYYDKENSGLASLYKRKLDYYNIDFSKSETVELDTIDHYCAEKKIEVIDFLKMDIEGNEWNALQGGKRMLEQNRIGAIQIEFGGCNIDARIFFRDFWDLLHDRFFVYRLVKDGLYRIKKYDERLECFACTNYLFVCKKRLSKKRY